MPVYNAEQYVKEAIESILSQTFTDLEFIAINDGSTDDTLGILESIDDPRFKFLSYTRNRGNNAVRNELISLARGDYIAWQDADDISYPHRLITELEVFDLPAIDIVYSSLMKFGARGTYLQPVITMNMHELKHEMFFKNQVFQPSLMFRRWIFEENTMFYNESLNTVGDYDLWLRCLKHGVRFGMISDPLVQYRESNTQIANTHKEIRNQMLGKIHGNNLDAIGINLRENDLKTYLIFLEGKKRLDHNETDCIYYILKFIESNYPEIDEYFLNLMCYQYLKLWKMSANKLNRKLLHQLAALPFNISALQFLWKRLRSKASAS